MVCVCVCGFVVVGLWLSWLVLLGFQWVFFFFFEYGFLFRWDFGEQWAVVARIFLGFCSDGFVFVCVFLRFLGLFLCVCVCLCGFLFVFVPMGFWVFKV